MTDCKKLIKSDLEKHKVADNSHKGFWYYYFFKPTFKYQVWLRITYACRQNKVFKVLLPISWLLYRHYEFKYGIHISSKIPIGEGLYVVHGDGVYVNADQIGDNFTVYQNATFGIHNGKKPTIKDNVTVNPNAVIYGDVILHDGCTIGANAVVNKDVEAMKTVAGVPAKIIK